VIVCTTVLCEYMKSLRNYVNNLVKNVYVRIKIYQEFYHGIIYIFSERCHVRKTNTITHSYKYICNKNN